MVRTIPRCGGHRTRCQNGFNRLRVLLPWSTLCRFSGDKCTPDYIINDLLPTGEIHLLAGPSGAGKTRWLIHTLVNQWSKGYSVLGHKSYPCPWVYVAADRSYESVCRTFKSMGVDPNKIDIIPAWDQNYKITEILDESQRLGAGLIVCESFSSFIDSPIENRNTVKAYLRSVQNSLGGMTMIGIVEQPKMKPRDAYANPRQRVSGVAAWGHFSQTIILVEPVDPNAESPLRTIHICPRDEIGIIINAKFGKDGILRPQKVTLTASLEDACDY